jgi:hypothetical protein
MVVELGGAAAAGGAAAGLSILASMFSITRSVKELMSKRNLDGEQALAAFKASASDQQKNLLGTKGFSESVLAMTVINAALLAQFEQEAADCQDKHIGERKKAKGDAAKGELADQKGKRCMCAVLKSVKKHNKGVLPAGQLQDWWESYGCDT